MLRAVQKVEVLPAAALRVTDAWRAGTTGRPRLHAAGGREGRQVARGSLEPSLCASGRA